MASREISGWAVGWTWFAHDSRSDAKAPVEMDTPIVDDVTDPRQEYLRASGGLPR